MKYHFLILLILLTTINVFAQRINIPVAQADSRFTITAERTGVRSGSENYYFYIQNNTNREFKIVVSIEVDLACDGTKHWLLGNNDIIHLQPNEKYSSSSRGEVFTGFANKDCAISEGNNTYRIFKSLRYSVSNVIDVSKKKEDELAKKKADDNQKKTDQLNKQLENQKPITKQQNQQQSNTQNQTVNPNIVNQQNQYAQNLEAQRRYQTEQTEIITKGVTDLGNLVGGWIQQNQADKERKEALREQREAEERERQYQLMVKATNRINAFSQLPSKDIPLSSQEKAASIYFFIYAFNDLNSKYGGSVYISNVFEIGKYNDGTRAYTSAIKTEIANLTPYTEVLHGYYYSKEQAEEKRQTLINTLQNNDTYINNITYKGKPTTKNVSNTTNEQQTPNYGNMIGAPAKIDTRPTNGTAPNGQVDKFKEKQPKNYGTKIE